MTAGAIPAGAEVSSAPAGVDVPVNVAARKGLKAGALGLVSSVVVGVASTAPAYSLAATLGFVVAVIGLQSPAVTVLAFVPILFVAVAYSELNKADPDCGTTFTWATRAFGPRTGWMGGWGIVAADVLVMASLAQIAGQYVFLAFGNTTIGGDATSGWVLLVGVGWIVAMTYICYRGIELSANIQKALLTIEVVLLLLLSVVALVKVGNGTAPAGHLVPALSWFNPFKISSPSAFVIGLLLMVFVYWGWDTTVSVNEETRDAPRTPGRAAVLSTLLLLATYVLVVLSTQAYAGISKTGIGLGNPSHEGDVLSVLGTSIFGTSTAGTVLTRLLIVMVLSSAAASTQTTILPTARTTLSMAAYRALPSTFARMHKRHLTPTVSTVVMGAVSVALYVAMNYVSAGSIIVDSVSALGVLIAFYYGLTGFACAWYYRRQLTGSVRHFFMRGLVPLLGGVILFFALGWDLWYYWKPANSSTSWQMPFSPHWHIGGVFLIDLASIVLGIVLMVAYALVRPPFFRGDVLNASTPTLVPESLGLPIGVLDEELHPHDRPEDVSAAIEEVVARGGSDGD